MQEFNINLKIALIGIEKIFPKIYKETTHRKIINIFEMSNLYHHTFYNLLNIMINIGLIFIYIFYFCFSFILYFLLTSFVLSYLMIYLYF